MGVEYPDPATVRFCIHGLESYPAAVSVPGRVDALSATPLACMLIRLNWL